LIKKLSTAGAATHLFLFHVTEEGQRFAVPPCEAVELYYYPKGEESK